MSFITRAHLRRDARAQSALSDLLLRDGDRDAGHRLVWSLFAEDPDADRDFIYRRTEPAGFLIVSQRPPRGVEALWAAETKPYAPRFQAGERLAFQVRVNPVRSLREHPGDRGRRRSVVARWPARRAPDPAIAWLIARGAKLGAEFAAGGCEVSLVEPVRIARDGAAPIRFTAADLRGTLQVTDPERLETAALRGVGPSKAYGCGLLLLRRLGPGGP